MIAIILVHVSYCRVYYGILWLIIMIFPGRIGHISDGGLRMAFDGEFEYHAFCDMADVSTV